MCLRTCHHIWANPEALAACYAYLALCLHTGDDQRTWPAKMPQREAKTVLDGRGITLSATSLDGRAALGAFHVLAGLEALLEGTSDTGIVEEVKARKTHHCFTLCHVHHADVALDALRTTIRSDGSPTVHGGRAGVAPNARVL